MIALLALSAHADTPDNWKFTLDGYYRNRGFIFSDLFEGQTKPATYLQTRLRLQPGLNFEDRAKFFMMVDGFDDVVWGDNESLASTALFAGDPSVTGFDGAVQDPIKLKRAWMDFKFALGSVRVGRMPSQWGMGLLANGGDGFDDTFGENHFGSTYDRVIFATKPITVATTIAQMAGGKGKVKDPPLFVAVGVDRLVEDPLIQYYGFECDPETPTEGCDSDDDHGVTEERTDDRRTDAWWVDTQDDVWEMIYVLIWRGDGQKFGPNTIGDLTAGLYMVNRRQEETDSNVLIVDGYAKVEVKGLYFEGEILHIGGDTRAITLTSSDVEDPLYKKANIWGYVAKGGLQNERWTAILEHGYASGDNEPTDPDFTGRPLHPDYNVGFVLYEEILSRVTAATWGEGAKGLWSNGGVYNSRYVFPNVRFRPITNWEFSGAWLVAWPSQPDGARIFCAEGDDVECVAYPATSKMLGWEADLAIKHRFADHVNFTLEGGFAHVTDRVNLRGAGLNTEIDKDGHTYGNFFTLQSRIAYEF